MTFAEIETSKGSCAEVLRSAAEHSQSFLCRSDDCCHEWRMRRCIIHNLCEMHRHDVSPLLSSVSPPEATAFIAALQTSTPSDMLGVTTALLGVVPQAERAASSSRGVSGV